MNGVIIFSAWLALCRVLIPTAESSGGQQAVKSTGWLLGARARRSCGTTRWMQPRWKTCECGLSVMTALAAHEGTTHTHTHEPYENRLAKNKSKVRNKQEKDGVPNQAPVPNHVPHLFPFNGAEFGRVKLPKLFQKCLGARHQRGRNARK